MKKNIWSKFPGLETQRMILREIVKEDAPALFMLYSNPEVMKFRGADSFSVMNQAHDLIQKFSSDFTAQSGIRWGLTISGKEDELIGTAGFNSIDWKHQRGVIGYEIQPSLWNQGLMTEALKVISAFAFRELNLHTIEANIAPANIASEKVLRKLGFVKEAHFRENWYYKGWWDSVIYSLHK
jgi:ribosomal-protein-alanine N-acetyltransferase